MIQWLLTVSGAAATGFVVSSIATVIALLLRTRQARAEPERPTPVRAWFWSIIGGSLAVVWLVAALVRLKLIVQGAAEQPLRRVLSLGDTPADLVPNLLLWVVMSFALAAPFVLLAFLASRGLREANMSSRPGQHFRKKLIYSLAFISGQIPFILFLYEGWHNVSTLATYIIFIYPLVVTVHFPVLSAMGAGMAGAWLTIRLLQKWQTKPT